MAIRTKDLRKQVHELVGRLLTRFPLRGKVVARRLERVRSRYALRSEVLERRIALVWWQGLARAAVTIFILWHLFATAMWTLPYTTPLITSTMKVVRPYMTGSGFMQGWAMFAPDPYSLDIYVEAKIRYADGSVRLWQFPRMNKMSFWQRYQKERWRKYIEVAHQDTYNYLWPAMARYAARVNDTNPGNPPVSVDLTRHFRLVRPPDDTPAPFNQYKFFTQAIAPEDLR